MDNVPTATRSILAMVLRRLAPVAALLCAAVVVSPIASPARADDTSLCDPQNEHCRSIDVVNNCTDTVWVATQGNAIYCDSDAQCESSTTCNVANNVCNCTSDADCGNDQVCDTNNNPAQCEWARPMGGGWELASSTTDVIYVPSKRGKSQDISWAGRFWGRTGCPDFGTCALPGAACDSDSDCCTNAGCIGLFECQSSTQCPTWACTTDQDCVGGTCNTTTGMCESCASGSCACRTSADCPDGGLCQNNVCGGQCEANGVACKTGDCEGVLQCPLGVSGSAPLTLAEVALVWTRRKLVNNYDTYDVSQVNGYNLPIEVAPTKNVHKPPKAQSPTPWCGRPGCADGSQCPTQNTACGFAPSEYPSCLCTWDTDTNCPATMQAVWPLACSGDGDCPSSTCDTSTVPPTCTCTSNADCPAAAPTCGLNTNIAGQQVCGTYAGCMAANDACTTDSSLSGDGLDCSTWSDLYGCSGAGSCYSQGAGDSCCGCPSWSPGGNTSPPVVDGCQASNSNWTTNVQPLVETFKNACPSSYGFQYDDPTSTFHCAGKSLRKPLGYTVTFCPCGAPGALAANCSS